MPASFKAAVGFGLMVDYSDATALGNGPYDERLDDLDYEVSHFFPLLDIKFCGDAYEGTGNSWIMVKDSVVEIWDEWSSGFNMNALQESLTDEAMEQLFAFVNEYGVTVGTPGWQIIKSIG